MSGLAKFTENVSGEGADQMDSSGIVSLLSQADGDGVGRFKLEVVTFTAGEGLGITTASNVEAFTLSAVIGVAMATGLSQSKISSCVHGLVRRGFCQKTYISKWKGIKTDLRKRLKNLTATYRWR